MKLIIVIYRDVFLWSEKYKKDRTDSWEDKAAFVRLAEQDLKALGISGDGKIKLSNSVGSIVVRALADSKGRSGYGFMPVSPLVNRLTSYGEGRLPNFKRIEVTAEATKENC
ncbi:MAG: hypothetical protein C4589_04240 [Peptococcaceae bacterium]|jgi:formylmethanofuran dehydrogenase subunit D|nr:MAG: hypothetical protein C4589_04240 [Peptococcaceae bacterium]